MTLLRAMGTRGGWHADALCAETGLHVGDVMGGLPDLELAGLIRRDAFFDYQAVAPPGSRGRLG